MSLSIKICPFKNKHQVGVDKLLHNINGEFEVSMFSSESVPMKEVAHVIGNKFWVAMDGNNVIGTIGIIRVKNKNAVIKSLFLAKEYRGKQVAKSLLNQAIVYCNRRSIQCIYLGTMDQMKAAHQFYEKNGFLRIDEKHCPPDFNKNPLDDVFYKLILIS